MTVEDIHTQQSYSAMKRVLIRDDDEDLFNVPLQPILYHYYKENSKEIRRMVKQQGAGFWIQFVTSFRSFISNSGLDRTGGCESYEEAFIDMLKILTTKDSFTEFVSLIESLKTLHVLLSPRYGYLLMGAHIKTAQIMSGFNKPFHTFPIYTRFVGAVVVLYQRWKHAPRVKARTSPAKWIPPVHWSQENGHGPRSYERYLYDSWGYALYRMIHVDKAVMEFFNPQTVYESTGTSSSKTQNNMSNVCTTQQRKNRNRRRRNRNKNKNGGVTRPSGTLDEAVLVNETDSSCVKGDGSGVEHGIAGDGNNAESGTVGCKKKQKRETDPSVATSNMPESTGKFRYDRNSSRNINGDSDGSNMKEGGDQKSGISLSAAKEASSTANTTRKGATFRYDKLFSFKEKGHVSGYSDSASAAKDRQRQKEEVHPPAETELATETGATSRCTEDDFFLTDSIVFGTGKHTGQNTSMLGENNDLNNDVKSRQRKENVPSPKDEEPTSCHSKTANSFRYDRLFTFSKKVNKIPSGGVDVNEELDTNPTVRKGKKKGAAYHPTDKQFTTNRDTVKKTEEKDFFRYDRLFNFSTRKQNAPENTDNKQTINKTEEKDFFRYDRLFNFSTGKQNVTGNTDDASISSDDLYQDESGLESENLDDDYTAFHEFNGGFFRGPFQHAHRKKKMSPSVRKYLMRKCSNCNILEKYPGMYKACKRCLAEGVQAPKVYCGEHCGRTHWRKQHRADHKTFGNKHTTFRK